MCVSPGLMDQRGRQHASKSLIQTCPKLGDGDDDSPTEFGAQTPSQRSRRFDYTMRKRRVTRLYEYTCTRLRLVVTHESCSETSSYTVYSNSPHSHHHTAHFIVFSRWRLCAPHVACASLPLPNGITIGSSVFAGLGGSLACQTHKNKDMRRPRCIVTYVTIARIAHCANYTH